MTTAAGTELRAIQALFRRSAMALAMLLGCSCGQQSGNAGGGAPAPFIQIDSSLSDGATNIGDAPLPVTFAFFDGGKSHDDAELAALMARLSLTTWPEREAVPASAMLDPTSTAARAAVAVSPGSPLADRWYALGFGPPADGLVSARILDDGGWGVRVRHGSHAGVRLLEFCGTGDVAGMKFIAIFSEPVVVGDPAATFTLQKDAAVVSCRFDSASTGDIHEFCAALTPGPVTVTLSDGAARSVVGAVLPSQTWTLDIGALPLVETGCRGYLVPPA